MSKEQKKHPLLQEEENIQKLELKVFKLFHDFKTSETELLKLRHHHEMNAIKASIGILHESLKPQNNEKEIHLTKEA